MSNHFMHSRATRLLGAALLATAAACGDAALTPTLPDASQAVLAPPTATESATYEALCDATRARVTNPGIASSMCAKLRNAAAAAAAGDAHAARNSLQAYVMEVYAHRGRHITTADANYLIAMATQLLWPGGFVLPG
ncbi:MAG TPA: hypothetical protein VFR37_24280 [Longimicrobium sp.]|nr:hypothetical protein [Longimicrobium sp.]